jgi:hypothetical protein
MPDLSRHSLCQRACGQGLTASEAIGSRLVLLALQLREMKKPRVPPRGQRCLTQAPHLYSSSPRSGRAICRVGSTLRSRAPDICTKHRCRLGLISTRNHDSNGLRRRNILTILLHKSSHLVNATRVAQCLLGHQTYHEGRQFQVIVNKGLTICGELRLRYDRREMTRG